jgi:hypothetical protein
VSFLVFGDLSWVFVGVKREAVLGTSTVEEQKDEYSIPIPFGSGSLRIFRQTHIP